MKNYLRRVADSMIAERLLYAGAILVEGPKWCGKTTTCEQHAKSVVYISDPARREYYLDMARMRIEKLIEGAQPRLFDEWQEIPELWDAIRFAVRAFSLVLLLISILLYLTPLSSKKAITFLQYGQVSIIYKSNIFNPPSL